ncbi:MAG: hypothetical protein HUU16_22175 [Candidatus Omnitrophica bacterium]|nr:hypothetical protein [Candidatus Omnitrophota bacterium]
MQPRRILSVFLVLLVPIAAQSADKSAAKAELLKVLGELVQPMTTAPEEGKAWVLSLSGQAMGKEGEVSLAWDGHARHAISARVKGLPSGSAVFADKESWLLLPEKKRAFFAEHEPASGTTLLDRSKSWKTLCTQVPALLAAAMFIPIPDDLTLDLKEDGSIILSDGDDLDLVVARKGEGVYSLRSDSAKFPGHLDFQGWKQVPVAEFEAKFARPADAAVEKVEVEHLRSMLVTLADFASESILVRTTPEAVAMPLAGIPKVDGTPVVRFKGTPEEMGRQHGTLLKEAVHYNMHRTLHGVGLVATLETGDWFPGKLETAFATQEKYIPERFIREVDAMAEAAEVPRNWARAVSVFPEYFHCSGLALSGKATVGGKLYHGRVLDYMTDIGLQNTAVVMVFEPEGHNAWVSMGYAGLCSTVTAMNEKGLSFGEMGGRGEGYLEGIPMTFMMREVVERFDTVKDALAWIKETPRTCEYFYVIADAKTKSMAGIASLAKKLAEERGEPDLTIIEPGQFDERLPSPVEDCVLLSADNRYNHLVERVRENYGKLDMQGAWDLMRGGVAMKSNLYTVLFAPESLDFWAAQAGIDGKPAYTQKISKFNLRELLKGEPATQTSDAGMKEKVN